MTPLDMFYAQRRACARLTGVTRFVSVFISKLEESVVRVMRAKQVTVVVRPCAVKLPPGTPLLAHFSGPENYGSTSSNNLTGPVRVDGLKETGGRLL